MGIILLARPTRYFLLLLYCHPSGISAYNRIAFLRDTGLSYRNTCPMKLGVSAICSCRKSILR